MQPGETISKSFEVINAATGAGVTGLLLANFTVTTHAKSYGGSWASFSAGQTITEIGGGKYAINLTLPSTAGEIDIRIQPTTSTYQTVPAGWGGEVETNDRDSIYVGLNTVRSTLATAFQLGAQQALTVVKNRYRLLQFSIVDGAGAAVDGSGYTGLSFGVRSDDQTTTTYDLTSGLTFDVNGLLTVPIPEDAGFFAALGTGIDSTDLNYEITGNQGGDSAKTVPLVRSSTLTITRCEVGT